MAPILSYRPLEPEKSGATAHDGLPRVVRFIEVYTDEENRETFGAEVLHVLYLLEGAALPHSMLASAWPGLLPTDPTPQQSEAAITARETERGNRQAAALLKKQGMRALAQSSVGVKVGALNPRQVEALLGLLLLKIGGLDDDLKVLPLEEWAG